MSSTEIFRVGDDRLLCDDWHAPTRTVVVRPGDPRHPVRPDTIMAMLDELATRGVERVRTAALDPGGLESFAAAGFVPVQDLCVLHHDLRVAPERRSFRSGQEPRVRTRRANRRRDVQAAAHVDARAFPAGEAVDDRGITTILEATPIRRFRLVATESGTRPPAAYAISGLAGRTGYVQRLAVDPTCRRHGNAHALVTDALTWFRRRHVDRVFVNTDVTNIAARRLYVTAGFVPMSDQLAVWEWNRGRR